MKKLAAGLLALALLLSLTACGWRIEPKPVNSEAESPVSAEEVSPDEESEPPREEAPRQGSCTLEELLQRLDVDEETYLWAARRAVMQEFDRAYLSYPEGERQRIRYYQNSKEEKSALDYRAATLAVVTAEGPKLSLEGDVYWLTASFLTDGGQIDKAVELDFTPAFAPGKTVSDEVVTASLREGRVFLSFADTEQAAYYLLGYGEADFDYEGSGRGYELPGDSLPLGPQHEYEVKGLFSDYTDLFLGNLGREYLPYLFLATRQGTVEVVNIIDCFRYGVFCAMPVPGNFGKNLLSAEAAEDACGDHTVYLTDEDGMWRDMAIWAMSAKYAGPRGAWSGALEEIKTDGGSYFRMANLEFYSDGAFNYVITELDQTVDGGSTRITALGMTEEGIICGYTGASREDRFAGAFAYSGEVGMAGEARPELLQIKTISGVSPYGQEGEIIPFYKLSDPENGGEDGEGSLSGLEDRLPGLWMDTVSGRCYLDITLADTDNDIFAIEIEWGDSASTTYRWTMTGYGSFSEPALYYEDCVYRRITLQEDGTQAEEILSFGSSGSLVLAEPGQLLWQDESFPESSRCVFERLPASDGA